MPELFDAARGLLGVPLDAAVLPSAIEWLAEGRELRIEVLEQGGEPLVYLPWLAASEAGLAASVEIMLARAGQTEALASDSDLQSMEGIQDTQLHPKQRSAVLGLLAAPLALLTGGPGVGKTTIVHWVVRLAEARGAKVLLASPPGAPRNV